MEHIPKSELEDGAYYEGICRNARVARWNAADQRFYYWRVKLGDRFIRRLPHLEDEQGFDCFRPHYKIDIPFQADAADDG